MTAAAGLAAKSVTAITRLTAPLRAVTGAFTITQVHAAPGGARVLHAPCAIIIIYGSARIRLPAIQQEETGARAYA